MVAIGLTAGSAGRQQSQSAVEDRRFHAVLFDHRRFPFERPDSWRVTWPIDRAPESFTRRGLKEFNSKQEENKRRISMSSICVYTVFIVTSANNRVRFHEMNLFVWRFPIRSSSPKLESLGVVISFLPDKSNRSPELDPNSYSLYFLVKPKKTIKKNTCNPSVLSEIRVLCAANRDFLGGPQISPHEMWKTYLYICLFQNKM